MTKGCLIRVEGRLQNRSFEDKQGVKQYRTGIVAESVQFGPRRDTPKASEQSLSPDFEREIEESVRPQLKPMEPIAHLPEEDKIDVDSMPF